MKIKVTEEHIKNGKHDDSYKCPVALAISEVTGEKFFVGPTYICSVYFAKFVSTPEIASKFIRDFDSRCLVEPFEFDIALEKQL